MKTNLLLSLASAAVIMLAGATVTAQAEPQINNGMPGIVMAGSQNYNKIPEKARKFVDKHFKGTAVSKCEQYFAKGKYEVELANGVDIDFNRMDMPTKWSPWSSARVVPLRWRSASKVPTHTSST